jgi:hypothetical protein
MTRRRATILLHWSVLLLLLLHLAAGAASPALAWAFALAALAMVALAVVFGLMNGPGPRLQGRLRRAYPALQRGMYALLAFCATDTLAGLAGLPLPGPESRILLMTLLAAASLHALFHLWRHTVLHDGALRRITPRLLHGML